MIAVCVRPLRVHAVGSRRIDQRVVEREEWDAFVACDLRDQPVELPNRCCLFACAVVPRQYVGDGDTKAKRAAALHHLAQIACSLPDRPSLCDVVDSSLYDEDIGTVCTFVEPRENLVRPLAVASAIAKREPRIFECRPVLPLRFL